MSENIAEKGLVERIGDYYQRRGFWNIIKQSAGYYYLTGIVTNFHKPWDLMTQAYTEHTYGTPPVEHARDSLETILHEGEIIPQVAEGVRMALSVPVRLTADLAAYIVRMGGRTIQIASEYVPHFLFDRLPHYAHMALGAATQNYQTLTDGVSNYAVQIASEVPNAPEVMARTHAVQDFKDTFSNYSIFTIHDSSQAIKPIVDIIPFTSHEFAQRVADLCERVGFNPIYPAIGMGLLAWSWYSMDRRSDRALAEGHEAIVPLPPAEVKDYAAGL